MFSTFKRSLPLALALTVVAVAPAQSVSVSVGYRNDYRDAYDGGSDPYATYRASIDHNDYGEYFHRATAISNFRTSKLSAQVDGSGVANAFADLKDTLQIDRPDGGGSWGVFYAKIRAHAITNVNPVDANEYDGYSAHGYSAALLNLTVGQNAFSWSHVTSAYSTWEQGAPGPEGESWTETRMEMRNRKPDGSLDIFKPTPSANEFTLPFYFRFGSPFDIAASTSAQASLFNGGSVDTDFSQTYQWQGIEKVYALNADGSQSLLTGYSVVSGSGTDYAAPVPEPASIAALGAGLVAVLRRRKGRA